jgi:type IV pilus assembly protein PilB
VSAASNIKRIGDILIDSELITQEQLSNALEVQKKENRLLGETLIELGYVTEMQVIQALEFSLRIPYIDLGTITIPREALSMVSESLAVKHTLIPISRESGSLTIAIFDPLNFYAIEDVQMVTGLEVKVNLSTRGEIRAAIDRYYGHEGAEKAIEELKKEYNLTELSSLAELSESEVSNAPVVRLVNSIISHAVKAGASDIHIEPSRTDLFVRFRIDGDMTEVMHSSMAAHSAVITRIKIIGQMDIAEKRIPQDGRVETVIEGKSIDLRLSILPTVYGEKVVIRILGGQTQTLDIEKLGFTEENLEMFKKIISSPNGVFLVSGPTGSGKTTTLYAVLSKLNRPEVNIITVEDPVEYKLDRISQVQVNVKANLTFANGLRSILRQDPDIIMIGEIRDGETAEIAIRASITGHFVLSTIHTNDAASSIARLVDMGIEPFLVLPAL